MSSAQPLPAPFAHLVDLASDVTGAFALYATDDYFAEKENLLRPGPPQWDAARYTDKGKWMDGWESSRRRTPGHDWCVIRLGMPGRIHAIVADTTHFKGNAPQQVALEVLEADPLTSVEAILAHPGWKVAVPRTPVRPDHPNVIALDAPSPRATHVKLRIYPDGGVSRLRVCGEVAPDPFTFWRPGSIDLVAIENGGREVAVSDQFFGPPSNLTLPGRGVNMGDGWETRRRRTAGSDWCVLQLGRRGTIDRVEIDTHFFKGNAPQAVRVIGLDQPGVAADALRDRWADPTGWLPIVDRHPLVQHHRHQIDPVGAGPVTHVRVDIYPHGGVNRLRLFGTAAPTPGETGALADLAARAPASRAEILLGFCGSRAFADRVAATAPWPRPADLFAAAQAVWFGLPEPDWLEAFAAHPDLGGGHSTAATAQSKAWSQAEQAGVAGADAEVRERLRAGNAAYRDKFGFVFLLCATGRSAAEMADAVEARIGRSRAEEIALAGREQWKITRLRIGRWLAAQAPEVR